MPVIKQRKMSRFKVSTKYQRSSGEGGRGREGKLEKYSVREREKERRVHICLLLLFYQLFCFASFFYSGNFLLSRVSPLPGVLVRMRWNGIEVKIYIRTGKVKKESRESATEWERGGENIHMIGLCEASWESDMWHQLNAECECN